MCVIMGYSVFKNMARHTHRHSVYLTEKQDSALRYEAERHGTEPGAMIRLAVARLLPDNDPLHRDAMRGLLEVQTPFHEYVIPYTAISAVHYEYDKGETPAEALDYERNPENPEHCPRCTILLANGSAVDCGRLNSDCRTALENFLSASTRGVPCLELIASLDYDHDSGGRLPPQESSAAKAESAEEPG